MQQIVDPVLSLPTLDDPALQMVEQLPDILLFFDAHLEQVIEVPKIFPVNVPMRTMVQESQLVEQLVEVPTIVSFLELNFDIPVIGGSGAGGGLHGFLPGQSSSKRTANKIADIQVPSGSPQDFPKLFIVHWFCPICRTSKSMFLNISPEKSTKIPRTHGIRTGCAQSSSWSP